MQNSHAPNSQSDSPALSNENNQNHTTEAAQSTSAGNRIKSAKLHINHKVEFYNKKFFLTLEVLYTLLQQFYNKTIQYFKTFPIRFKVSLILTGIVLIVVTALSLFMLYYGKQMLRSRLDELCTVSIKSLSKSIGGYLLENRVAPISEAVLKMQKPGRNQEANISGLESILVINRNGKIVASAPLTDFKDSLITDIKLGQIKQLIALKIQETEEHYLYYDPILMKDRDEDIRIGTVEFKISKAEVLKPIARAQRLIILVTAIVVILSIIGIYFLSQKMVLQIHELSEGAKQVARGNLNIRIPIKTNDELGQLCREFNYMVLGLREKMQMQKFVSKATVRMIQEHGNGAELPRRSEKRIISVLFSDIRNFSLISEKHPPEKVVEIINIYLHLQAIIIEQNKGIVDKFIGDQVMGVFEGEAHEKQALSAAVAMQQAIQELNKKRRREKKVIVEVGVGLNNGDAVIGNMGSQDRMDYTVVGSMVNVGNHLCAKAKPRQIIATKNFVKNTQDLFPVLELEPIQVKGRTRPLDVFEIDYTRKT